MNRSTSLLAEASASGNPEFSEPGDGLLALARALHAVRLQHDQIRLEAARIRLEEERAEAARQTLAPEGAI